MIYGSRTFYGSAGYYGGAGSGSSSPVVVRDLRTVAADALLLVRDITLVSRDPLAYTNEREWTFRMPSGYSGAVDSAQFHFRGPDGTVTSVTAVDEGGGVFTYEVPDLTLFTVPGVWHAQLVLTVNTTAIIGGSGWERFRIGQSADVT